MHSRLLMTAATMAMLTVGTAQAAVLHFSAKLNGKSEVPPNDSNGTGDVAALLDTYSKVLTYRVNYAGLTGPAMAAHFHGPALPGANAPPIVVVKSLANPMKGKAMLTGAQVSDLEAGKWYFNIHTKAHPGGEIRGQLEPSR